MIAFLLAAVIGASAGIADGGDTRVDGVVTLKTYSCTLSAAGYTRDEGTPGHRRQRFVIYALGCGLETGTTDGPTRLEYTSSGELQGDQAGTFLVTATPSDPTMRKAFAERRSEGDEAQRQLMVFLVDDRVEIIVEDEP